VGDFKRAKTGLIGFPHKGYISERALTKCSSVRNSAVGRWQAVLNAHLLDILYAQYPPHHMTI